MLFVTLFSLVSVGKLHAQNGIVRGTVSNNNGFYLPGANVMIENLNKNAISDINGKYVFFDVPDGAYSLKVKYLGFEDMVKEIIVAGGETSVTNFTLAKNMEALETVVLEAYKLGGQAKALNIQKNKINITNIISNNQVRKFPDGNIGDALKRIPGITVQLDQGEARNIIIRGLAPQLNSVSINGSRIPSAEADNRNVQMDLIPSDMIQSVQVNKTITPNMPADAIGGAVNLITRSSPKDFRLSATAGSGINFITDKRILNASFLIGDRTENDKFGWMLSASINDTDFGSDNVEAEWTNKAESSISGEDIEVNPYTSDAENRTYFIQRIRRSFSANMDYAFNENNTIYLKTIYNWRDDKENRYAKIYSDIVPEFAPGTENIVGYQGLLVRENKGGKGTSRAENTRLEIQRMQNYTLGGEHIFNNMKLEWMLAYAKASEEKPNERGIAYATKNEEIPLNVNLSNPRRPSFSLVNPEDGALNQFTELDMLSEEIGNTAEEDYNATVDLTFPFTLFNNNEGTIQFGGRVRLKNKTQDNEFYEYEPTDDNPQDFGSLASVPTRNFTDPDFLVGSQYEAGSFVDPEFLGGLDLNNPSLFNKKDNPEEYLIENFDVNENVFAAYLMTTQQLTEKLSVLAGVRMEVTKTEAQGFQFDVDEEIISKTMDESSYTNILPGLHLKYNLNDKTVFRFAWTNTLARPNYIDLVPYEKIIREDEEIAKGNPNLEPTTSMNFDVRATHFFNSVGIASGGVFYKSIKDFIYTQIGEEEAGEFAGFKTFQPLNGENAYVAGIELAYQRQLDFLPGFAKNFGVYLNYTHITSEAQGITNEDGEERGNLELPGASPNMFNASLSYTGSKFTARLSANFSDAYISELGDTAFEDRYYDQQFFLDFNATFSINKNLSIYASLNNITNQPLRFYQGIEERTQQIEFYDRRLTFGVKYDIF